MKMIFLFLVVGFASVASASGFGVGNGGDTIECRSNYIHKLVGPYTLDYLMTLNGALESDAVQVTAIEESNERIQKLLDSKYPKMGQKFKEFLADLNNKSDWTKKRIWLPAPHKLVAVSDEEVLRKMPTSCGGMDNEAVQLTQTVLRTYNGRMVRYEYDFYMMDVLTAFPLQFSFMIVHEWLWDFTQDPHAIRWANHFIHSANAESLSPEDFKLSMHNIGIVAENDRCSASGVNSPKCIPLSQAP